jgi:membrane-associated phospholipid phosphatase
MTDATGSTAISMPRRQIAGWAQLLRQSFAAHWLVVGIPLMALIPVELVLATIEEPYRPGILPLLTIMVTVTLPLGLAVIVAQRLVQMFLYEKPTSPLLSLFGEAKLHIRNPVSIVNAVPAAVGVLLSTKAMLEIKMNIPSMHPFSWDETFMQLDRTLHGGVDPWLWLQPVFGNTPMTAFLDFFYNIWIPILFATWVYLAFRPKFDIVRLQFFLSFVIVWLFGGALIATLFSSAGPVYYSQIGLSPNPFAPLLDFLHSTNATVSLGAVSAQTLLWDSYTGKVYPYLGISAFPSMHNALAALLALVAWRMHRVLGILMTIFAGLILLGSVHLAWHYAVDSYAGILIAILSWWMAGRLARWNMRLPHVRQYRTKLERLAR